MTDLVEKKDELKKKIRSLLLSAPLGLTLGELIQDYDSFIGERLPTKELGYSTVEELLQDIPDAVQMTRNNGVLILKAISDASTQNIEKLVSKQKVDNKKKWGVLSLGTDRNRKSKGRGRHFPNSHGGPSGNFNTNEGSSYSPYHSRGTPMRHARHWNVPVVPAFVRGQIHELVQKHPSGIPLTHVSNIFFRHYGLRLDYKNMGFSSEYDLFASLADIVSLRKFSFGEVRLMSVDSASALEGCNKRQGHSSDSKRMTEHFQTKASDKQTALAEISQRDTSNTKSSTAEKIQKDTSDMQPLAAGISHKNKPEVSVISRKDVSSALPSSAEICRNKPDSQTRVQSFQTECGAGGPRNKCENSQTMIDFYLECNIPQPVQDNIRQVMSQRPNGIYASRLPFEYKSMFKKDLPYKTYGYNSVIEFAADLTHILRIERPHPQGDWHLLPVDCERTTERTTVNITKQHEEEDVDVKLEIDQSTQETISQVLMMQPEGILLERFEREYRLMTGQTLDYVRYGARDLRQFLRAVPGVRISSNVSGKDVVSLKAIVGPRRFDRLQDQYHPITAPESKLDTPVLHLPSDAVSPGCCYTPQPLPDFHDESAKYIDLYVSYVISPDIFWIQLRGQETTLALEDLMDDIEKVYRSKHLQADYELTTTLAKPGMICAAIFPEDGNWYRAIITDVKDQLYEVCYMDYGNVCSVSISSLRLLKTKFLKFPAQAIRARLSNIKPVDGVWRVNAKIRLLDLCREKPLVGFVTNVKDGVMSLCLTDTTNEYDIHINDVLVSEGYAVLSPDCHLTDVVSHDKVPSRELLFGENAVSSGPDSSPPAPDSRRYIRQVQMTDDIVMNLINLNGQLYILSSEISRLFFTEDVLSAQLCKDNVDISKVVVTRKNEPRLFTELAIYGAPNFNDSTNILSLFPLYELPLIVSLYGKDDHFDEVKATALEVLKWFNPDDPYWTCEDEAGVDESSGTDTHSSVGDASDLPGLEDLQLVHSSLVIKRKRILQQMLSGGRCKPSSVNDLNDVEWCIARVEALISKLQSLLGRAASVHSGASDGPAVSGMCLLSEENNDVQLPALSAQFKSTQRVAPTVQASPEASQLSAGAAGPADVTKLLEEHIRFNMLLLENLQMSQRVTSQQAMTGQSLSNSGQSVNTQQFMQPERQNGNLATTTVSQNILNPPQSSGNLAPYTYSLLTAPLAASTPAAGTGSDPAVSSFFTRLSSDVYSSNLQQFAGVPSQYLPQNQSPRQDGGSAGSQQSPRGSYRLQQSSLGSHMTLQPPIGGQVPHQFHNLNANMALDFNTLYPSQFGQVNRLPASHFEEFVAPTGFILPRQHTAQGTVPTSWYTTRGTATSMGLSNNMVPSLTGFPSSTLNYNVGVVPTSNVLLRSGLPQQSAHALSGYQDLMSMFMSSTGRDVDVLTANTTPGSGI